MRNDSGLGRGDLVMRSHVQRQPKPGMIIFQ
jgi:hypothetical protein